MFGLKISFWDSQGDSGPCSVANRFQLISAVLIRFKVVVAGIFFPDRCSYLVVIPRGDTFTITKYSSYEVFCVQVSNAVVYTWNVLGNTQAT